MSFHNNICKNLKVKILDQSDDLATFDCSKDDVMGLNEFFHKEALLFQKENLGVTHLFYYESQIVGFTTLAMSKIEIKYAPHLLPFDVTIKYYPALEIGRLAIHNDYRKQDVGKCVCLWCLGLAKQVAKAVGCKLAVVFTEGKPIDFYKKCGFRVVPKYEGKLRQWLFLNVPSLDVYSPRQGA